LDPENFYGQVIYSQSPLLQARQQKHDSLALLVQPGIASHVPFPPFPYSECFMRTRKSSRPQVQLPLDLGSFESVVSFCPALAPAACEDAGAGQTEREFFSGGTGSDFLSASAVAPLISPV
jgi:hypothetical protein